MKSLNKYILEKLYHQQVNEKLIINKNFENSHYERCMPDNNGYCLLLYFSTSENDRSHRIEAHIKKYYYVPHKDIVRLYDDNDSYIKNKNGYYWTSDAESPTAVWISILLFKNDAKYFLNTLLKDIHMKFNKIDFEEIFDSVNVKFNWPYQVKHYSAATENEEYYNESEIKDMIIRLKIYII